MIWYAAEHDLSQERIFNTISSGLKLPDLSKSLGKQNAMTAVIQYIELTHPNYLE